MKETKYESGDLKNFIILYIITTIVAFGIVLVFGPNELSMISALYTIALLFCGTAIILITDRYSEITLDCAAKTVHPCATETSNFVVQK
ncbi:MAG: hypothetical protein EF812_02320 [Methanosarcinales archaeon]|nr:MAG: hypothetical protein EF812_02320 [Methanosarcinales archaeon]